MSDAGWIDDLEADLGTPARLRLISMSGGRRRTIPHPRNVSASALVHEFGFDVTLWLAERFGGQDVEIPSGRADARAAASALLVADILEAGLTNPTRSANDLAKAHGVTQRWVRMLRRELSRQRPDDDQLSLF